MKRYVGFLATIAVMVTLGFALSPKAEATLVSFDFEGAPYLGGAAAIESYMEGVYGSDITVANGLVGNGVPDGPLGPDHYIQNNPTLGVHWFSISFNAVPIVAVSFDWGVRLDNLTASADGNVFFSGPYSAFDSGNTGTINFASPVTTLEFTDGFLGEIEIDNLEVTPVPEPATMLLLGFGLLGLLGYGIHRKKKNS
jgi:hypothetical protein